MACEVWHNSLLDNAHRWAYNTRKHDALLLPYMYRYMTWAVFPRWERGPFFYLASCPSPLFGGGFAWQIAARNAFVNSYANSPILVPVVRPPPRR